MTNAPTPRPKNSANRQLSPRALGYIALAGAAVVSWLGVWMPLHDAAHHAPLVSVSLKAAILAPMMIVLGVLYAFVPNMAVKLIGAPGERKPTTWFVLIPLLVVGLLMYLWIKAKIESYGYSF